MQNSSRQSDPVDIAAIRQGDSQAFERVFHRYYGGLGRFAMSYLTDPEEARDLVQHIFVKLWEKRGSLPENLNTKSYLYTAVRNACLNRIHHQKVRQEYTAFRQLNEDSEWQSPETHLQARELGEKIKEAIGALPDRCREAFLLSREEGLSYQEIADRMNISRKTVEVQMGKALKLLREALRDFLIVIILWMIGGNNHFF